MIVRRATTSPWLQQQIRRQGGNMYVVLRMTMQG